MRWEWRTFGDGLGDAETRLRALTPERVRENDETYLLSTAVDHAVKERDGLMDIKHLEQVNRGVTAQGEEVCEHAATNARRAGVKVELHAVPGDAADVLVDVATQVGADLVVVGNRGMSGARRFVLGSVPNKVSHHCPCSLLVVDTTPDSA